MHEFYRFNSLLGVGNSPLLCYSVPWHGTDCLIYCEEYSTIRSYFCNSE